MRHSLNECTVRCAVFESGCPLLMVETGQTQKVFFFLLWGDSVLFVDDAREAMRCWDVPKTNCERVPSSHKKHAGQLSVLYICENVVFWVPKGFRNPSRVKERCLADCSCARSCGSG